MPPAVVAAPPATAFRAAVRAHAERTPERPALAFLGDGEAVAERLSYGELDAAACRVAAALAERRLGGRPVLLAFPSSLELVIAFLGCLWAGVVAVPAPLPARAALARDPRGGRGGRGAERLRILARDAGVGVGVAPTAARDRLADAPVGGGELEWLALDDLLAAPEDGWRPTPIEDDAPAFLQYTSGSTAAPRGVVVTHRNLAANQRAIGETFATSADLVVVGWLPLHHDMGLIGNVLHPLWRGGRAILMTPAAFLARPRRWLEAIGRHRADVSGGPDFAYDLCVRRIPPAERHGLDLAGWRVAFDGAEPVRAATLDRFAEAFAPAGFHRRAFVPCYGLAEATLLVAGAPADAGDDERPVVREVDRRALGEPVHGVRRLVSSGRAAPGVEVVVVDPASRRRLAAGRVGEIWVAGAGVAGGYHGRPAASAATFGAELHEEDLSAAASTEPRRWLRTGDLGFLDPDGELFVTGRSKDLILVRGRNLYPQDVEATALAAHPALSPGVAAAFSLDPAGDEGLAVVVEIDRRREDEAAVVAAAVERAVADEHQVRPAPVVVVRHGGVPRTTSGKVRRGACRERLRADDLPRVAAVETAASDGRAAPGAPLEEASPAERLAALAAELLGRPVPADALLALDSLQAFELAHRAERELGLALPLEELLAGSAPAALAAAAGPPAAPAAEPDATGAVSAGERALWLLARLAPESAAHNLTFAASLEPLPGAVPPRAVLLRDAFRALARRHPGLRTIFPPAPDGGPRRRTAALDDGDDVDDRGGVDFRRVELESAAELAEVLAAEADRPFDLATGPLVRVRWIEHGGAPVLQVTAHHVVLDFWSLVVLLGDLEAWLAGRFAALPPAGDPAAAAAAEQALLAGPRGEELARFWRARTRGVDPLLDAGADRPRASGHRGGARPVRVPPPVVEAARALAAARGTTLFAVLLASWQALLGRLAGRDQLLVGVPAAGRTRAATAETVGYFVNLLPLRTDLSGAPGLARLAERAGSETAAALAHQDYPFARIVEDAAPPREPGRHPLVQVGLVLERPHRPEAPAVAPFALGSAGAEMELGGWRWRSIAVPRRTAELDLMLVAAEDAAAGGALPAALHYAADRFDATTAERIARRWAALLAAGIERPEIPVGNLPLLSPAERVALVLEWSGAAVPPPEPTPLLAAVARRAAAAPDAIAVVDAGHPLRQVTYRALVAAAAELAGRLAARGVGPEAPVAVLLERSPELIATLVGVLAAGASYLPIDPTHPPARVRTLLADSGASLVVAPAGALAAGEGVERLAPPRPLLAGADGSSGLPVEISPSAAAAAVVYTSGSTGRPKGVVLGHGALGAFVAHAVPGLALGPGERLLHQASPGFDAATFEIFAALAAGATLVVANDAARASGEALGRLLERERVTRAVLTPAGAALLPPPAGRFPDLAAATLGGEAAPAALARAWAAGRRLDNCYGPTETSIFVARGRIEAADDGEPPLGRPVAGSRLHLLDRRARPVPPGAVGEIAVGGAQLARGYLGRPAATAERFVPDPFAGASGSAGGRLYRTGDLGRHRGDGTLEFRGRADAQLEVRGMRVEPGEVEAVLAADPRVAAAAVVERHGRLIAWIAGDGLDAAAVGELRRRAEAELPAALVPSPIEVLPALPRTSAGKVDRRALGRRRLEASGVGGAPRDRLERAIAGVLAEVLGVETLGVEDHFFELGGHSVAAVRAQAALAEALGREVPLVALFSHPTVAGLAAHLRAADDAGGTEAIADGRAEAERRAARRRRSMHRRRHRPRPATAGAMPDSEDA